MSREANRRLVLIAQSFACYLEPVFGVSMGKSGEGDSEKWDSRYQISTQNLDTVTGHELASYKPVSIECQQ